MVPPCTCSRREMLRSLVAGSTLMSGAEAPIRAGNTLPVRNIPVGSTIHCIVFVARRFRHQA